MDNIFKRWLGVKVDAEGEKDVLGNPWNQGSGLGSALGISDPGHSHGVGISSDMYQNMINQQAAQMASMMGNTTTITRPAAPSYKGFRTDIEPTEDGFVVTVFRRFSNGGMESEGKKFIAASIEEATQKIAAGIALFKLDDSNT